jgi:quinol monooxygenase YgiN
MIIEYVRYRIPEDRRDAFERAYEEARHSLDASPECLSYELARCTEDPAAYVLRIEWTSRDGHMLRFRKSGEFRTFLAAVQPFVTNIEEMRHYDLIFEREPRST